MVQARPAGSGTIRGLAGMLNRVVQRPFNLGSDLWDAMVRLSAILPDYLVYGYMVYSEGPSVPAGSNILNILATVPDDERWRLRCLKVERQSGDNVFNVIRVYYPAAYQTGTLAYVSLTGTSLGVTVYTLPNGAGVDNVSELGLLLEPGCQIAIFTGSTGVAASVFAVSLVADVTKIIRVAGQEP